MTLKLHNTATNACIAGFLAGFLFGVGAMSAALKDSNAHVEALHVEVESLCAFITDVADPSDLYDYQGCR